MPEDRRDSGQHEHQACERRNAPGGVAHERSQAHAQQAGHGQEKRCADDGA